MKKSQITTEYMILLGIVLLIVVIVLFYTWKPKQDITLERAQASLKTIAEYVNDVAELGPGNLVRVKVEIPPGVEKIDFSSGQIQMYLYNHSRDTELHEMLKANLSGCLNVSPGVYDFIFESMGSGVCVYTPGKREKCCYCFFEGAKLEQPTFRRISNDLPQEPYSICQVNGADFQRCDEASLEYNDIITNIGSMCVDRNSLDPTSAKVEYSVVNRNGDTVFDTISFTPDSDGLYEFESANYVIENSGWLQLTSSCIHECYYVNSRPELRDTVSTSVFIPYGRLVPFLFDEAGNKIYTDEFNYYVKAPQQAAMTDWHLKYGWVKKDNQFIVRTGYECVGGECVMVNASLYHGGN